MPYLGKTPSQATRQRYYKTASGGETSLSGTMTTGGTLTFSDGEFVDVSVNGVALVAGTDYNTTTANTIGGLSALSANDQVEIVVYDTFSVFGGNVDGDFNINNGTLAAEAVTVTSLTSTGDVKLGDSDVLYLGDGLDLQIQHNGSGTFITDAGTGDLHIRTDTNLNIQNAAGSESKAVFTTDGAVELYHDNSKKFETTSSGVSITGGFAATDGCTISTADNDAQLTLTSTDADASVGPLLDMIRDSSSPADSDTLGRIRFRGDNDAGEVFTYGTITSKITDASDGTEGGLLTFLVARNGSVTSALDLDETETVFNNGGLDADFRVESDGNANMLVVDGGNNSVGIGLAAGSQESGAFLHSGGQCLFQHNHTDTSSSGNVSNLAGNQALTLVNAQGGAVDQTCKLGFTVTTTGANSDALIECKSTAAGTTQLLFYVESSNTIGEACRIVNQNGGDLNFGGMSTFSFANTETQVNKFQINSGRNTTDARTHAAFGNPNGQVGSITTNGSATAFNTSSDHRLKENVADMTGAIDRVKALAPKRFNFIADADTTVDGFLAHEAQTVVPEAVTGSHNETEAIGDVTDADGNSVQTGVIQPAELEEGHSWTETGTQPVMQGIDQSKLVPLLTGALQEAIAKIEALETRLTALEDGE